MHRSEKIYRVRNTRQMNYRRSSSVRLSRMASIEEVLYENFDDNEGDWQSEYTPTGKTTSDATSMATVVAFDFGATRPLDMRFKFQDEYEADSLTRSLCRQRQSEPMSVFEYSDNESDAYQSDEDDLKSEPITIASFPRPGSGHIKRTEPEQSAKSIRNYARSFSCFPSLNQDLDADEEADTLCSRPAGMGMDAPRRSVSNGNREVSHDNLMGASFGPSVAPSLHPIEYNMTDEKTNWYRISVSGYNAESLVSEFVRDNGIAPHLFDLRLKGLYYRGCNINGNNAILELNPWLRPQISSSKWQSILETSDGVIVVYDVADRCSFALATEYCCRLFEATKRTKQIVPAMVLAVDAHLTAEAIVSEKEGMAMAHSLGLPFGEVAISDHEEVDQVFATMVYMIDRSNRRAPSLQWTTDPWIRDYEGCWPFKFSPGGSGTAYEAPCQATPVKEAYNFPPIPSIHPLQARQVPLPITRPRKVSPLPQHQSLRRAAFPALQPSRTPALPNASCTASLSNQSRTASLCKQTRTASLSGISQAQSFYQASRVPSLTQPTQWDHSLSGQHGRAPSLSPRQWRPPRLSSPPQVISKPTPPPRNPKRPQSKLTKSYASLDSSSGQSEKNTPARALRQKPLRSTPFYDESGDEQPHAALLFNDGCWPFRPSRKKNAGAVFYMAAGGGRVQDWLLTTEE